MIKKKIISGCESRGDYGNYGQSILKTEAAKKLFAFCL